MELSVVGTDQYAMVSTPPGYVLSQNIAITIPGFRSTEEAEVACKAGNEFNGLTRDEKNRFNVVLDGSYSRDCGLCMRYSENLNIPAILRFHMLYMTYELENWAQKLYGGLEVEADECNGCGQREP